MNGIDISGWQKDIDLSKVPCDFVIIKATQGNGYVNPYCDKKVQQCISLNKCWGVYHYINGANNEIAYFADNIKGYLHKGIIALDWEKTQNAEWGNTAYLESCIAETIRLTRVKPLIYASASVFPYELAKRYDCGTWVARYANNNATGYQAKPWGNDDYVVYQYSSHGKLAGYAGFLDLNKANVSRETWMAYANPNGATTKTVDIHTLALNTLKGMYGTGSSRKKALGNDYEEVQRLINHWYDLAHETKRGAYGNGNARKARLGADYDGVQFIINKKMV